MKVVGRVDFNRIGHAAEFPRAVVDRFAVLNELNSTAVAGRQLERSVGFVKRAVAGQV